MLFKRLDDVLVKKIKAIQTNDTSNVVKKNYDTKIKENMIKFTINILLLMILINFQVQYLMKKLKQSKLATTNNLNTVEQPAIRNKKKKKGKYMT